MSIARRRAAGGLAEPPNLNSLKFNLKSRFVPGHTVTVTVTDGATRDSTSLDQAPQKGTQQQPTAPHLEGIGPPSTLGGGV